MPESRWTEQHLGHAVVKAFKPPGTTVYGADKDAEGVRAALAAATPERAPEWSAS